MKTSRTRLATFMTALIAANVGRGQPLPLYVGKQVCLECHAAGKGASPCELAPIPQHDRAYRALNSAPAEEIAALTGGTEPPRSDLLCLGCHATGAETGPRWMRETFDIAEGVQCEACHDAGSFHVQSCRNRGRDMAGGPTYIRRSDHSACTACHVARHSHEEVLARGFRRSPADRLYKTPVNLTVSPDGGRLYVCCEHSDSVTIVDAQARTVEREIGVGRRPHDLALSPNGRTLYVSNRLSNSVSIIDTESGGVVAEIPVGGEPHGVLPDATGRFLLVLNTGQDSVSVIDTAQRTEIQRLSAGVGPWSVALDAAAGLFYVTNVRPNPSEFRAPHSSEITVIGADSGLVVRRAVVESANMLQGVTVVPHRGVALVTLMRTKNLVPITRVAQGWTVTNGLGVIWADGRVEQVLLDEPNDYFPDPTDLAVSPDGRFALVTSGGADEVALVDVDRLLETLAQASPRERAEVLPNHLGASARFVERRLPVGASPRAVTFSPDGRFAYVANSLDDSVTVIDTGSWAVAGSIRLGGPAEVTMIRRGEQLFHSAGLAFGRQFSCRSCHPDGHSDGLAFDIESDGIGMQPVDNRSLRGIGDTAPFKWEGTNPTLQRQCGPRFAVFFTRLAPLAPQDLDALAHYVCTIERPRNPRRPPEGLTLSQRRGKAIFERAIDNSGTPIPPAQRCASCHSNAHKAGGNTSMVGTTFWLDLPADADLSNFEQTDEFGSLGLVYYFSSGGEMKPFDTPHLTNVSFSAPYLHNGGAATLEEIWTRFNPYNVHGVTGDLTRRQFNDLIDYLKSL